MTSHISHTARCARLLIPVLGLALLTAACGDDDATADADAPPDFETPALDVETLTAEVPDGTLTAEARPNAFVGEVTDDLFVGISTPDGTEPGSPVTAYLCDGDDSEWLTGRIPTDGTFFLSGETSVLELDITDDTITGTAEWDDQPAEPFTATPATGDAGLYATDTDIDDNTYTGGWIVLPDGRQLGHVIFCRTSSDGTRVCVFKEKK